MDNNKNLKLVRELGNHLMAEFELVIRLFGSVLSESKKDLISDGEESLKAGENKYEILSNINNLLPALKEDYLNFSHLTGNDTGLVQWEFPFDETFKDVDLNMDNQVVDRFFDSNVYNVYLEVKECRKKALFAFRDTVKDLLYCCPCCEIAYFERNGDFAICPVCGWENDKVQNEDIYYKGGANEHCLSVARAKFLNFGKTLR